MSNQLVSRLAVGAVIVAFVALVLFLLLTPACGCGNPDVSSATPTSLSFIKPDATPS